MHLSSTVLIHPLWDVVQLCESINLDTSELLGIIVLQFADNTTILLHHYSAQGPLVLGLGFGDRVST